MSTIYIIQGFLCAGKTTFSKQLAINIGAIRLNADEYVEQHHTNQQQLHDWNLCFSQAVDNIWQQTASYISGGQDVILDIGFWDIESRDYARQQAAALGAKLVHYYVYANDIVLLKRLNKRTGLIAKRNIEYFEQSKAMFESPLAHENAIVIENLSYK